MQCKMQSEHTCTFILLQQPLNQYMYAWCGHASKLCLVQYFSISVVSSAVDTTYLSQEYPSLFSPAQQLLHHTQNHEH